MGTATNQIATYEDCNTLSKTTGQGGLSVDMCPTHDYVYTHYENLEVGGSYSANQCVMYSDLSTVKPGALTLSPTSVTGSIHSNNTYTLTLTTSSPIDEIQITCGYWVYGGQGGGQASTGVSYVDFNGTTNVYSNAADRISVKANTSYSIRVYEQYNSNGNGDHGSWNLIQIEPYYMGIAGTTVRCTVSLS